MMNNWIVVYETRDFTRIFQLNVTIRNKQTSGKKTVSIDRFRHIGVHQVDVDKNRAKPVGQNTFFPTCLFTFISYGDV